MSRYGLGPSRKGCMKCDPKEGCNGICLQTGQGTSISGMRLNPPNPKQRYGDLKVPLALVPSTATIYMARAFKHGAEKYGPFNWRRDPVEALTYAHATLRHLYSWLDGEAIDPESGAPHLGHALACLAILADAEQNGALIDTRPKQGRAGELLRDMALPIDDDKFSAGPVPEKEA